MIRLGRRVLLRLVGPPLVPLHEGELPGVRPDFVVVAIVAGEAFPVRTKGNRRLSKPSPWNKSKEPRPAVILVARTRKEDAMPDKRPSVKNEKQYEKLKEKGMSKERAARIANSPGASSRGGKKSHSGSSRSSSKQGGTTAQKKAAGRKGGKAAARKS
jgi:hypothetical protein